MLVQVLELAQVDFHLQVRKADLSVLSQTQEDTLMQTMDTVLKVIINKGYLVTLRVTVSGAMT